MARCPSPSPLHAPSCHHRHLRHYEVSLIIFVGFAIMRFSSNRIAYIQCPAFLNISLFYLLYFSLTSSPRSSILLQRSLSLLNSSASPSLVSPLPPLKLLGLCLQSHLLHHLSSCSLPLRLYCIEKGSNAC